MVLLSEISFGEYFHLVGFSSILGITGHPFIIASFAQHMSKQSCNLPDVGLITGKTGFSQVRK